MLNDRPFDRPARYQTRTQPCSHAYSTYLASPAATHALSARSPSTDGFRLSLPLPQTGAWAAASCPSDRAGQGCHGFRSPPWPCRQTGSNRRFQVYGELSASLWVHDELLEFVLSHPKQGKPRGRPCSKAEGIRQDVHKNGTEANTRCTRLAFSSLLDPPPLRPPLLPLLHCARPRCPARRHAPARR